MPDPSPKIDRFAGKECRLSYKNCHGAAITITLSPSRRRPMLLTHYLLMKSHADRHAVCIVRVPDPAEMG